MLFLGALCVAAPASANEEPLWRANAKPVITVPGGVAAVGAHADGTDTEHIFGFSMGSDIGQPGEIELEMENVGALGKRNGGYATLATLNQVKYTLTDRFRIAPGFALGAQRIDGVAGFDDRHHMSFNGATLEFRYKLIDRAVAPFGLTLHAQPGWNRVDDGSGLRVSQYGAEFAALFDRELVKDRWYAAFNIWYGTGVTREHATGLSGHDSDFALHGALSYQVQPGLVVGVGTRYLRSYDGGGLDRLAGEAVYVGPTFSYNLTDTLGLSGTWQVQLAGRAVGDGRHLDLENFERHQAMLRINAHF
ncbi:transporter [Rhodopseudomonas palustris]|uniref:transporter n=1 Tax=Rhodopseudomonas palustris TaxID=1076 RepID=UPI002ACE2314|nr:transporter [Rhodopseudomonas palustris]WQH00339.1 transporter [Rhodopseudomonas palustris]